MTYLNLLYSVFITTIKVKISYIFLFSEFTTFNNFIRTQILRNWLVTNLLKLLYILIFEYMNSF